VSGVVVVLRETLADFTGGDADDGVGVRVVGRGTVEDFDGNRALFDLLGLPIERLLDDVAQEGRVSLALEEERVREELFHLREDGGFVWFGLGRPGLK